MLNRLRNVLAPLAGIAFGGGVDMALITLGPSLVPPPAGVDCHGGSPRPATTERPTTERLRPPHS